MDVCLDSQVHQLEEAEAVAVDITTQLTEIKLKGGWSISKAAEKQERLRALAAPPTVDGEVEIRFLRTISGEIVQVISSDEEERPIQLPVSE